MNNTNNEIIHHNVNNGVLNDYHMKRLTELLDYALEEYSRVLAFMVRFNLPVDGLHRGDDAQVISRLLLSLNAQTKAYQNRRKKAGKRIYPCRLLYAWVREYGVINGNRHYHVLFLLNREVFRKTMLEFGGEYKRTGVLTWMLFRAWHRALRYTGNRRIPVSMPTAPYELSRKDGPGTPLYDMALNHFSYLAKEYTKVSGDGYRNFGCSQIPRVKSK
jgi:hypothetical protein